jgi:GT2 family glycosyltransferase
VRWLPGCLDSVAAQTRPPDQTIVVDNGSTDGSLAAVAGRSGIEVIETGRNLGFAAAANRGMGATAADAVALVNTDVVLAADWLERMCAALQAPDVAAVACKMVDLADPGRIYDAGDVLRRDGVCEQRGRFAPDDGRWDEPGEVFAACAGAALYRRGAVLDVGGFDERFFLYLEDVDLGLRLRLAGWRCRYEPRAVARHAGEGSAAARDRPAWEWVERNTLLLAAKAFPLRWAGPVAYRQAAWAWRAARERRLGRHLRAAASALPLLPVMARERRRLRARAAVPVQAAVPRRPIRRRARSGA